MPTVSMLVAVDEEDGIGLNGKLPWHVPEDLKHFKETTMGSPLVMGRKTYESMPKFVWRTRLPCVLTARDIDLPFPGYAIVTCNDIEMLLESARQKTTTGKVFVIGGAQTYKLAYPFIDEALISRIPGTHGADTFLPAMPPELRFDADIYPEGKNAGFWIQRYVREPV